MICMMRDFNINFLNYESHTDANDYVNKTVSHYLLPDILQATRVTDHSAAVIDNIFPNAADLEMVSGNVLNQIVDHF